MSELLKGLIAKGWKRYISYPDPRLSGEESYKYTRVDIIYSTDPSFTLSLEQWMMLKDSFFWRFYADGVFIKVGFHRDRERMDPTRPGAYLLTFKIYDKEQHAKNQFDSDDHHHWYKLWIDEIQRLKAMRYKREAELEAQGYAIDTGYEEPKVHWADPVEPGATYPDLY